MEDPPFLPHLVSQTEYHALDHSLQPISRVNVGRPAQANVLAQTTFQSQPPRINTAATPVRRKPVPNSASPSTASPRTAAPKFFPTTGQVIAVGAEERHEDARPPPRPQETSIPSQRAWLQQDPFESPRLEVRNLDEYARYIYTP